MRTLSHDAFARTSLVRETDIGKRTCDYCGQYRKPYRYGTERDDKPGARNVNWHKGWFCCKGCHDNYHG